jgi:hypothetical protein
MAIGLLRRDDESVGFASAALPAVRRLLELGCRASEA